MTTTITESFDQSQCEKVARAMNEQPDYFEPILRFDLYSIVFKDKEWHVMQLFKNLSWLADEIVSGTDHVDFCKSVEYTGWVGTCPEWCGFKPVVTVPRGDHLDLEHIEFICEAIQ
jgi:hypothetical protein